MADRRGEHLETLGAVSWDVRANAEAQVRALTELQRCLDHYQRTQDPDALSAVARHLMAAEKRADDLLQALALAKKCLAILQRTPD